MFVLACLRFLIKFSAHYQILAWRLWFVFTFVYISLAENVHQTVSCFLAILGTFDRFVASCAFQQHFHERLLAYLNLFRLISLNSLTFALMKIFLNEILRRLNIFKTVLCLLVKSSVKQIVEYFGSAVEKEQKTRNFCDINAHPTLFSPSVSTWLNSWPFEAKLRQCFNIFGYVLNKIRMT